MFNNVRLKLSAAAGLVSTALVATSAFAAVDTTAITGAITDAATAGAVIGGAVLAMYYGLKLYKWVKQAG